jgi:hypothetical protein
MREYGVNDYGLLLTKEVMMVLAAKHCEDFTEEDFEEDEWSFCERVEEIIGEVDYIGQFTGEATRLEDDGTISWGAPTTAYYDDCIYYIPMNRAVSLFKPAYNGIDEMINDFKSRVGEYMPDDFNYRDNICQIVGTYWG